VELKSTDAGLSDHLTRVCGVKIYLATIGSRGDNEPFRARAREAAAAGHDVYFAHTTDLPGEDHEPYTSLSLPGSFEGLIAEQGVSITRALLSYRTTMKPMLEAAYLAVVEQIQEITPDVVVYHPKLVTAPVAAHAVGAIAVIVEMFPTLTPTAEFPALGLPHGLPGFLNRASFRMMGWALGFAAQPAKKVAKQLGVVRHEPDLTLCPVSQALVPQPKDWPAHALVTGAWTSPTQGTMDAPLQEFLSSGPVVYAGFGSMKDTRGAARAAVIVEAARLLGFKTLLVTGWGGLEPSTEHVDAPDVMVRSSVPHAEVLPQVAVAIHHGGAGTTHAMIRAGIPSVIMPFVADQPWWAARLKVLGLGPGALSKSMTNPLALKRALVKAIECADAVRTAAEFMALEDGLGRALGVIEDAEAGVQDLRPA
jgi:sterol 3beta-glucosyltransferase